MSPASTLPRGRARQGEIIFDRAEGYLGVMIDDLVTRGVTEPYRMFTSRAEYRLTLRADNADQRLTAKGIAIGCVGAATGRRRSAPRRMRSMPARHSPARSRSRRQRRERHGLALNKDGQRRTAMDLLSYPNIGFADVVRIWPQLGRIAPEIAQQIEIDAKYSVYLDRQAADVAAYRRDEGLELPESFDYGQMTALSMEVRQKLESIRPRTIGQAGRIDGITPAALTLLVAHIRREHRNGERRSLVRARALRPGLPMDQRSDQAIGLTLQSDRAQATCFESRFRFT